MQVKQADFDLKKTRRMYGAWLAMFLLACVLLLPSGAQANSKYASMVIDASTGQVLHERHADKKRHPASLTKVMTLLMVFDALETGRLKLSDPIYISTYAAGKPPSKLGLKPGSVIRVEDAIYALVTKSANDIAAAIGERLGGTEANFAHKMTRKARLMGMHSTTFKNASGLHHPGQVTTARDMMIMARKVIYQYPDYYKYFSTKNFSYKGKNYHNHNRLMSSYRGMDGMKTGYIGASGFNLIASAIQDNRRLIGIVFGGRSAYTRNAHMAKLLDQGFQRTEKLLIAQKNVPVPARKPVSSIQLASLSPETGTPPHGAYKKWASLNPNFENTAYTNMIAEGDADPDQSSRITAGVMAMQAHTETTPKPDKHILGQLRIKAPASSSSVVMNSPAQGSWGIQIGAFTSKAVTRNVLKHAVQKIPHHYAYAKPEIMPLKTTEGWLYRARLNGFSKQNAFNVCKYLEHCVPVAP